MWVPRSSPGPAISHRAALIVLSLTGLAALWVLAQPPMWVMFAVALVLPTAFFVEATWLRHRMEDFEPEFTLGLQRGDSAAMAQLLRQYRLFLRLAPPAYRHEKLGLAASLAEDWGEADVQLELAFHRRGHRNPRALLPAILRAKYENGLWNEAEEIAEELIAESPFAATAELFLGLILVRREGSAERGQELLESAAKVLAGADQARAQRAVEELSSR